MVRKRLTNRKNTKLSDITIEVLENTIEKYIEEQELKEYGLINKIGLCLRLGISRPKFDELKKKKKFKDVIEEFELICEQNLLEMSVSKNYNYKGVELQLKNNYGYTDKVEVDNNISGNLNQGIKLNISTMDDKEFNNILKENGRTE